MCPHTPNLHSEGYHVIQAGDGEHAILLTKVFGSGISTGSEQGLKFDMQIYIRIDGICHKDKEWEGSIFSISVRTCIKSPVPSTLSKNEAILEVERRICKRVPYYIH